MTGKNNPKVKERAGKIRAILKKTYPDAHCLLNHKNALEILVATILAAQCTDVRVNMTTPALFRKFRTAADYAGVSQAKLEKMVKPCGFFRNKAKAIRNCCTVIAEKLRGAVPDTMEELTALPGIGRKSANLILSCAYDKPGIIVDTHVRRLTKRLGITRQTNPDRIETDLNILVTKKERAVFSFRVADHGRAICTARKPRCGECPLGKLCPSAFKT
jgi:endonuclease-3